MRGLVQQGRYGEGSILRSGYSTGGLHCLLTAFLHLVGSGRLEVIRLISPLCLAGLLVALHRLSLQVHNERRVSPWIALSSILSVRGSFMLGAQAYGEILGTLLVALGALYWGKLSPSTWSRRGSVGILLGLAAAVRLNCVLALLALPVAALLVSERRRAELIDGLVAMGIGGASFLIQWQALRWISVPLHPEAAGAIRDAYGLRMLLGGPLAYIIPLRLNFWMVGEDLFPFTLAVLVTVGWMWARRGASQPRGIDLLLSFAWILWLAWHVQSPIAHLRYLWPAMIIFAFVGGLTLAQLYRRAEEGSMPALRRGIYAVCAACVVAGYLDGARSYLHGEGDIMSWEWHRGTRQSLQYGPLKMARWQRKMGDHLRRLPQEEAVATLGADAALTFLTGRTLIPMELYYPRADRSLFRIPSNFPPPGGPRWLVVWPFLNRYPASYMTFRLDRWMQENCTLEATYGPFILYKIVGPLPDRGDLFDLSSWEPPLPLVTR